MAGAAGGEGVGGALTLNVPRTSGTGWTRLVKRPSWGVRYSCTLPLYRQSQSVRASLTDSKAYKSTGHKGGESE